MNGVNTSFNIKTQWEGYHRSYIKCQGTKWDSISILEPSLPCPLNIWEHEPLDPTMRFI